MRMIAWLTLLHGSHLSCVAPCAGEIAFLGDAQNKHRRNNKPVLKHFLSFSGRPFKGREKRGNLATCVWIVYESIQRLFFQPVDVDPSIWAFLVVGLSIAVDVSRSRVLYRAVRKHNSQALEADSLHFSTDIWSSSVVISGLVGVVLARTFPGLSFLQ